ncbi:MAG: PQQ-binding-like beta-propeller repeat protein, partial [Planctomycetes bacterium]|nr:PQQ-binding-like beta-propeller repeat protein [Planctomycetota bacterium]
MNQGMLSLLLAIAASAIGPADVLPAEGTEQEPKWLETVWTAEVGEDIYESPEVQGGRVYAANSCGAVTSLDLTSGKVLARTTFDLGSNHRLPIQVAATPDGLFLARGHLVRRCDLTNLETVWSADLGESHQCLAVAGGRLLTTTYPDVILLDAESGKVIWRKKVGSQGRGVLLGGNFALYASNTEECRFLDLVTGETRWTARAEEYCHALALGPGVVYYGSGAYRLKDGSALWTV